MFLRGIVSKIAVENVISLKNLHYFFSIHCLLQGNPFVCDKCHIVPLLNWMKSSLTYWGTCMDQSNALCLKCAQPDDYLHMPLDDLSIETLPECQEVKQAVPYNDVPSSNPAWDTMMKEKSYLSTYIAGGFGSLLLFVLLTVLLIRYAL